MHPPASPHPASHSWLVKLLTSCLPSRPATSSPVSVGKPGILQTTCGEEEEEDDKFTLNHQSTSTIASISSSNSSLLARRNKSAMHLDLSILPFVQEMDSHAEDEQRMDVVVESLHDLDAFCQALLLDHGALERDFALASKMDEIKAQQQQLLPSFADRSRDRYANVRAIESTRVKLLTRSAAEDYINANFISLPVPHTREGSEDARLIVTQAPLVCTGEHFWEMCWEQESRCIVMLNDFDELGKEPAFRYFDARLGQVVRCGGYEIECIEHVVLTLPGWRECVLRITTCTGNWREIRHLQCLAWEDFAELDAKEHLLGVKRAVKLLEDLGPNAIVHCSAGLGRSGALVAIFALCQLAKREQWIKPSSLLAELRRQRPGLVQTVQQYKMVLQVSLALL